MNLSSGRTNVYNLAKTCEAVGVQEGVQSTLLTTDHPKDKAEFFRRMGIRQPFGIVFLSKTDTTSPYVGKKWYEAWSLLRANGAVLRYMLANRGTFDAVYFRDSTLAPAALFGRLLGKKLFFEIHSVLKNRYGQWLNVLGVRAAHGVVAISSGLKKHYERINRNTLLSLCSAAEETWFNHQLSSDHFRKELGLPLDKFLIGYVGVVGANPNGDVYEIDDTIRALAGLPQDVEAVVAGELGNNADWLRAIAKESGVSDRVTFLPWQERSRVPHFLQAFDVELIPRRKKDLVGDSPAKMFPALASRRPIIAGRSESIEDVLTNNLDALIVATNTPEGWRSAIEKLYKDVELRTRLVQGAERTSRKYTWPKRGELIVSFITNLLHG